MQTQTSPKKRAKALRKQLGHHPSNPRAYAYDARKDHQRTGVVVLDPKCSRSRYQIVKRHGNKD